MPQPDDRPGLTLDRLNGGRNGYEPPHLIPPEMCTAAENIDWILAAFARKRGGSTNVSTSGGTAWTGKLAWLSRYIPAATEADAQLWAADDSATPFFKYLSAGTSWANVTMVDTASAGTAPYINGVTFNGKHFVAYDSAVDRLHVVRNDGTLNRMGLAQPAVPTTGAPFAGAVTDTRTYKTAFVVRVGGVVTRRSELSVATGTVALAAQQVTITRAAVASEGETDWELYAASTDSIYWKIATVAIGTATSTDNNATLPGITGALAPQIGINALFPSVKYLATDGNRLFGAESWESGRQHSRVWFTPVLGDNDIGDDERFIDSISRKTYIDLNENDGGYITGLAQPIQGVLYVFKFRQVWKLVPTGDFQTPYLPYRISSAIGCVSHRSICIGQDESGNPCVYFTSHIGPCRVGDGGVEYLGTDIEDLWTTGPFSAIGRLATSQKDYWGIYYPEKSQYWLWIGDPVSTIFVFDRRLGQRVSEHETRGGWSKFTSGPALAQCACLFANTLGASMSFDLKPYVGGSASANTLFKGDTDDTSDNGTTFAASVTTKVYSPGGPGSFVTVSEPQVVARALSATLQTITVTITPNYDATQTKTGILTVPTSLATVAKVAEGCRLAGLTAAQWTFGDSVAQTGRWQIEKVFIPYDIDQQVP